jgi:hypothetical protein
MFFVGRSDLKKIKKVSKNQHLLFIGMNGSKKKKDPILLSLEWTDLKKDR